MQDTGQHADAVVVADDQRDTGVQLARIDRVGRLAGGRAAQGVCGVPAGAGGEDGGFGVSDGLERALSPPSFLVVRINGLMGLTPRAPSPE